MEDATKKTVRELLEVCQALGVVTNGMEAVGIEANSLGRLHDQITDIIWRIYDITLAEDECSDNFMTVIIDYSNGEFEIDECLEYLAEFAASTNESEEVVVDYPNEFPSAASNNISIK